MRKFDDVLDEVLKVSLEFLRFHFVGFVLLLRRGHLLLLHLDLGVWLVCFIGNEIGSGGVCVGG